MKTRGCENAPNPSVQAPNRITRTKAAKAHKTTTTGRCAKAKKPKNLKRHVSTKPKVVAAKRDRAKDPELKPQSDWRWMNFNRLACPVSSAKPDSKCFKSCSSGELDISHLREHLKNFHACDCDCQQTDPCPNPMHLSNKKLARIKTVFKQRHESDGDVWGRIYQELYPGRKIPVPYLVSFDQVEAVARDPTERTKVELYRRLERCSSESLNLLATILDVEECLCLFSIVLGVIRDTGASPAAPPLEE